MKIATYNVNGVNGRLPVLLRWLDLAKPDIVTLQELKAPQGKFPQRAINDAGYEAIWHGQSRWNGVAILSRIGDIHETRRGLPGDPDDKQSRYIEAAVGGVLIAGLYLPNGNPRPGPRYDFKLRWFERLEAHIATLRILDAPVVITGDFNVMPTDKDVYAPERWRDDALFAPEVKAAYRRFLTRAGPMPSATSTPTRRPTHSGNIGAEPTNAMPACASTIYSSTRPRRNGSYRPRSIAVRAAGRRRATTLRCGSSLRTILQREGGKSHDSEGDFPAPRHRLGTQ